jgi:proteasome lid subunit RPN8/RPN11
MLYLTPEQRDAISVHGEQTYPHECCGFLIGVLKGDQKRVEQVRPAGNAREDSPQNRYLITDREYYQVDREVSREGRAILGFYHSHPDVPAEPSAFDLEHAPWPGYSMLIMSVNGGRTTEMHSWVLKEDRSQFDEETIVVEEVERDDVCN